MQWVDDLNPDMEARIVALARRVVASQPDNASCRHTLADALRKAGRLDEARACLEVAVARFPDDFALLQCQVRVLRDLADFAGARAAVERALRILPSSVQAQALRVDILIRTQDWAAADLALDAAERAVGPSDEFFYVTVRLLTQRGAFAQMLSVCDSRLVRAPGHTSATYFKAMALSHLGRNGDAREVLALDRFTKIVALPPPPGFDESFRDTVAAEILRNPTLVLDPAGKATRAGFQTRHLRQPDAPAVEALLAQIKGQLEDYAARLDGDDDPFARARPSKARLSAWSVVYNAQGRQTVHHHASGWLSGVFYVGAPRAPSGGAYDGSLLLGTVTADGRLAAGHPGTLEVEPVPGRIVLFPSYVPHATLVPRADKRRIVVSFDVVPEMSNDGADGYD